VTGEHRSRIGGCEPIADAEALRATGQHRVVTPAELVDEIRAQGPNSLTRLHPMIGRLPFRADPSADVPVLIRS
jgi:hypothetical protein